MATSKEVAAEVKFMESLYKAWCEGGAGLDVEVKARVFNWFASRVLSDVTVEVQAAKVILAKEAGGAREH